MPNDLLIKLNIANFRVRDVSTRPVYKVGEVSGIKIRKVIFTIPLILFKGFWSRLFQKYVIRDFHPLVFFYSLGTIFGILAVSLVIRMLYFKFLNGFFPPTSSLAAMFSFISCSQFTLFASTKKGNRPGFTRSARPEVAIPLYEDFVKKLGETSGLPVGTGEFGADMKVRLLNDGPVTIWMDTKMKE